MTRLFRPTTPRLADWTPPSPDASEQPTTVVTFDRDEHRDALREDVGSYRRVGGSLYELNDLPDEGDL